MDIIVKDLTHEMADRAISYGAKAHAYNENVCDARFLRSDWRMKVREDYVVLRNRDGKKLVLSNREFSTIEIR